MVFLCFQKLFSITVSKNKNEMPIMLSSSGRISTLKQQSGGHRGGVPDSSPSEDRYYSICQVHTP